MSIITNANKPFCKFCFDSGKSDYNTHWLRETMDKKSVICCPELKKIKCRYCKEPGHTISYCKVLKEKERQASIKKHSTKPQITSDGFTMVVTRNKPEIKEKKNKILSEASLSGMFAALECDDADDEDYEAPSNTYPPPKMPRTEQIKELEPSCGYLKAVKSGIRAAPELEKEFHTPTKPKSEIKLVYERGALNWADECE